MRPAEARFSTERKAWSLLSPSKDSYQYYKFIICKNQEQLDSTNNEINQLVYQLYGLTDQEIAVVEGK